MKYVLFLLIFAPCALSQSLNKIKDKKLIRELVIYSNIEITESNCSDRTSLIFVVHGDSRDAKSAAASIMDADKNPGTSVIVAPFFAESTQLDELNISKKKTLYWNSSDWKWGGYAKKLSSEDSKVSSFEVAEIVIKKIKKICKNISNLKIVGHSAGGQFVQRFTAYHKISTSSFSNGIVHVVSNPSSYLYFSKERPVTTGGSINFETPVTSCSNYNNYRFGLSKLPSYVSDISSKKLKSNYKSRTVKYLIGELDADPADSSMDQSCGAIIQGTHRRERAENFYAALNTFFGANVYERHSFTLIPSVGHSARQVYTSQIGRDVLFN